MGAVKTSGIQGIGISSVGLHTAHDPTKPTRYLPECVEEEFSEVHIAPVHYRKGSENPLASPPDNTSYNNEGSP
jgi:hypothetical protein